MSFEKNCSNKIDIRSLGKIGLVVLGLCLCLPTHIFGESLTRTISLEATDQEKNIHIPVGSTVTFLNNYPQDIYETAIVTGHTDKKLLSIESFESGQSFGLQFSKKGPYSICYSLQPKTNLMSLTCLQIIVVPLQTA